MILVIQGPMSATAGFSPHLSDSSRIIKQLIFPSPHYPSSHPFQPGRELPLSFPSTSIDSLLLPPVSFRDLGCGWPQTSKAYKNMLKFKCKQRICFNFELVLIAAGFYQWSSGRNGFYRVSHLQSRAEGCSLPIWKVTFVHHQTVILLLNLGL